MNLKSKLSIVSLVTVGALSIGICSYELTSKVISRNFPQEGKRDVSQNSKTKYFDLDAWMFDMIQKNQVNLYINPQWYFQYARDKTSTLSI